MIKIGDFGKVFSKWFCFIRSRIQLFGLMNRGSVAYLSENTISNLPKVPRAKFLKSDGLFFVLLACASLVDSRNLLQWLLACLNFTLDSEDIFIWYKQKSNSVNYGRSRSTGKLWRWVRLDLIPTMSDISINSNLNLTKFTSNSRSTEFKDILPWNIF